MYKNIKIEKLDDFGRGICYINDKITFVENALPNEIVDIDLTREKSKYNEATVVNYIEKSKDRVKYNCPYYEKCGGCNIAHLLYQKQLDYKRKKVEDIVRKYTKYKNIRIEEIYGNDNLNYRNKVTLHIQDNKIGYFEKNSKRIVNINECLLLDKSINAIIGRLHRYANNNQILSSTIIIRAFNNEALMLLDKKENKEFLNFFNDINIIMDNKNIKGKDYLIDNLFDKKFKIKKDAFYQVNNNQVKVLYDIVRKIVKKSNYRSVLDLYCGTGTIGIIVSQFVDEVLGVEVNQQAIEAAIENKKINNISNIEFILGKVEDKIDLIKGKHDLIIVDPPRSGLDKHVIDVIKKLDAKEIIYVSCDPITMARDINYFDSHYKLEKIKCVDMFMNTYHCESVCILERR